MVQIYTTQRVCQLASCGRTFPARLSNVKRGRSKYCSVLCGNTAKIGRPTTGRRRNQWGVPRRRSRVESRRAVGRSVGVNAS